MKKMREAINEKSYWYKLRSLDSRSGVIEHFKFEGLAGRAYLTPTRDYIGEAGVEPCNYFK